MSNNLAQQTWPSQPGIDTLHILSQSGLVLGGMDPNGAVLGTNGSAAALAGSVGEIITATVAVGSATSLTTATPKNVTSISVTPGDWDIWGVVDYVATGATVAAGALWEAGLSLSTDAFASQAGGSGLGTDPNTQPFMGAITTTAFVMTAGPSTTLLISATTNLFLVAEATFTAGTVTAYGSIFARRRR